MEKNKKEKIKLAVTLAIIIVAFGIAITIMLKYNQEGEQNMPFNLSEIIVVSSAEGKTKEENPNNYKWNLNIIQYNDIYIQITKNSEYEKNSLLFMDSEIVQFSKSSAGFFKSFDTAQTAINYKAEHFPVSPIRVMDESNPYYIISRQKLFKAAELVLSKAEKYGNQGICFSSLGSVAFSDYSDEKYINRNHMEEDVSSILSDVKKDGKTAAVAAANDYAACAADILFDTPDSNGSYTVFDMEIPFYQMVFHSYKPMYTQAVNLSENSELMVAKAAAFGMGLGYTLSYRYEDRSDELDLYKLYGTVYKDNTDNIYDALVKKQFAEIYEKTCDARIVCYELLSNGVSKTEFSNGLTLYANQQNVGADSPAGALAPYEFRITG